MNKKLILAALACLLDNVVVEEVPAPPSDVPEPASIALLALGLASMRALRGRHG